MSDKTRLSTFLLSIPSPEIVKGPPDWSIIVDGAKMRESNKALLEGLRLKKEAEKLENPPQD